MDQDATQSAVNNRPMNARSTGGGPKPVVRPIDAVGLIVGIVIGAGIFRTPSLVAGNASSESLVYLAWIVGGVVSLVGALVYAELATTYPDAGGDYYFLRRALGHSPAFLFGWARMTVIQTGSIASACFIFGDYASQILSLGAYSSAIYAGIAIIILTLLNVLGVRQGTGTQNLLTATEVLERSGEMALLLGATYGRLQSELLTPLIQRGWSILRRRGEVPDIAIDGRTVQLDYRSPLARAQGQRSVQNTINWITTTMAMGPEAQAAIDLAAAHRAAAEIIEEFKIEQAHHYRDWHDWTLVVTDDSAQFALILPLAS